MPPAWFHDSVATPAERLELEVAGAAISALAWGPPDGRPVVLVHGGAAHARWWSPIAPLLVEGGRRIVAIDLSGHGDSAHRPSYHMDLWGEEILTVARQLNGRPATLVGHSMGGIIVAELAVRAGDELDAAVIVDAPTFRQAAAPEENLARRSFRSPKLHPSREEALARFRLVPPQPAAAPWYVRYVAEHSVVERDGGWTWKYDPAVFRPGGGDDERVVRFSGDLRDAPCPTSLVVGERSYLLQDGIPDGYRTVADPSGDPRRHLLVVPAAAHHVMLDQPIGLATALRAVLP